MNMTLYPVPKLETTLHRAIADPTNPDSQYGALFLDALIDERITTGGVISYKFNPDPKITVIPAEDIACAENGYLQLTKGKGDFDGLLKGLTNRYVSDNTATIRSVELTQRDKDTYAITLALGSTSCDEVRAALYDRVTFWKNPSARFLLPQTYPVDMATVKTNNLLSLNSLLFAMRSKTSQEIALGDFSVDLFPTRDDMSLIYHLRANG